MAEHRQETNLAQAVRVLRPSVFARMPSEVTSHALTDLLVLAAQVVLLLVVVMPTWFVIAWAVSGVLGALVTYIRWTRYVEQDKSNHKRTKALLASRPGGAPIIAEVTAHCGCTHRWAWDPMRGQAGAWIPAEIVESSDQCLVEAR